MNAKDKITKATVQIALSHPFWATFLFGAKKIEDPSIPTGCTDGKVIRYNPDFIDKLTPRQTQTFLAHEAGHIFLGHPLRRGSRDLRRFNEAGDYVINGMLEASGFDPIDGWLINPDYTPLSTEEVYNRLPPPDKGGGGGQQPGGQQGEPPNGGGQPGQQPGSGQPDPNPDPGGCGGFTDPVNDDGTPYTEGQIKEAQEEGKIKAQQALENAKRQGKLPAELERYVEELCEPAADWREILSRFVGEVARNDYSWTRPSRRSPAGISLPGMYSETFGEVVLAVDTSGSISMKELQEMVSECAGCIEHYTEDGRQVEIPVVYCDCSVQKVEVLGDGDKPSPKGGGGTRFSPVMDWVRSDPEELDGRNPAALIYMTDGYCDDFGEDPGIPVLWVLTEKNDGFDPPFGDTVALDRGRDG